MKKVILFLLCLSFLSGFSLNRLYAAERPQSLTTDWRIQEVHYSPDEVYEITFMGLFQTAIEFAPDETILVMSIGDSNLWQVVPVYNRLFIKPVFKMKVSTNLLVETNRRTYNFRLIARPLSNAGQNTYMVRFNYPKPKPKIIEEPIGPRFPEDFNLAYKIKHNKKSGFIRAMDDGLFTYFEFQDFSQIPAIFAVEADGKESMVNWRLQEPYVVVERMAKKFVLRRGKVVGKVINQTYGKLSQETRL